MHQTANLHELEKERIQKLIELGQQAHYLQRKGELNDADLLRLSKEVSQIESVIYAQKEPLIPPREMNICPGCKKELLPEAMFCNHCGVNIAQFYDENVLNCSICHAIIPKDVTFCPVCGSRKEV